MSQDAIQIYNQGYCYYTGSEGYPLNYNKALECFKKAAELGVSHAMNYLGLIYEDGEIVEQNYRIAVDWFYRAIQADSGNAHAAYNLGRMYYNGTGVEKDMTKAYQFCKAAVDLGLGNKHSVYPQSCYLTGCILIEHYNNHKDSVPYFVDAAKYGNIPEAWYNLGWLSENGYTPLKNPGSDAKASRDGMARGFYEDAAKLGYVEAMDAVGRLYCAYQMYDEARPWLEKAASMGYEPAKKRLKMIDVAQGGSLWGLFGGLFK